MRKGTYLLFLTFNSTHEINVGALGTLHIDEGEYCYVGSAMNGLDSRVIRHFSREKKIRWHIDPLTLLADGMEAFTSDIPECTLATIALNGGCVPVFRGFGSSDCVCHTHLFTVDINSKEKLLETSSALPFHYDAAAVRGTRSKFMPKQ
jgi:Uri superfamily endonuclease